MTRQVITLPIKCSTVHTLSDQLERLIAYEVILSVIAAAAFLYNKLMWAFQLNSRNLPLNTPDSVFFLIMVALFTFGFGTLFILVYAKFYIELFPKLECIRDV